MERIHRSIWFVVIGLLGLVWLTACQQNSIDSADQGNQGGTNNSVTVEITAPANGLQVSQNQTITFGATAGQGGGGPIEPQHLVWTSDRDGIIGTGYSFTRSGMSPGQHTITLTATGSNGENGSASINLTNQPVNGAVSVRILSPAGQRIKSNEAIELRGSAVAPDGTPITDPTAFEWMSSRETTPGPELGDAPRIVPAGLTPGLHTITLNVSAPDGNGGTISGSASIDLFVEFVNSGISLDILQPLSGFQNQQGTDLICSGSGSAGSGDFQRIVWTSSIDGEIGSTETCIVPFLSLGTHRITMTATTTDGRRGSISTIVEVVQ